MAILENTADLFRVLMHPTRLAILQVLRGDEQCVCHMVAVLGLRQAHISQQLSILRQAGLVTDRRDGWNVFYHIARPEVIAVLDAAAVLNGQSGGSDAATSFTARPASCTCPKCQRMRNR